MRLKDDLEQLQTSLCSSILCLNLLKKMVSYTTIEHNSKVSIWIKKRNVHAQKTLPETQLGILLKGGGTFVWLRFVFTFIFSPLFSSRGYRGTPLSCAALVINYSFQQL